MASCADIRAAVTRGDALDAGGPRLEAGSLHAHLAECPACAVIARDAGLFAGLMAAAGAAPPGAPPPSFAASRVQIEAERGAAAWLRSRPTWMRRVIALSTSASILGAITLALPRPDLGALPLGRMMFVVLTLGAGAAATTAFALRAAQAPSGRAATWWALLVEALGVLVLLAFLPAIGPGAGAGHTVRAASCFAFGAGIGMVLFVLLRMLDRRATPLTSLAAAASAGLVANLALHLHCPGQETDHLLLGHVAVAAALGAGVALWLVIRRRAQD